LSTHQNKRKALQQLQQQQKPQAMPTAHGSDAAPVIYFDGAVAYGLAGTTGRIELAVTCTVPVTDNGKPGVRQRVLVTCHLRASLEAMAQLADAIEKMLTMAKPPSFTAEEPAKVEEDTDA
jgi:hypothetical protein